MKPVMTVEEMRVVDAATHEAGRLDEMVARAGWAVSRAALSMLGGTYGRRVAVVAGKGNNGADGRVAASHLRDRGASVSVFDVGERTELHGFDLVIDAAFGTGFRGQYTAPSVAGPARILAVDIPSGVDGDTGSACPGAVGADVTVTFVALKPGLLSGDGAARSGRVVLADIGLDTAGATAWVVETADVITSLPPRSADDHKWSSAVAIVAGSPGMMGSARLAARAAQRAGAGMVRLGVRGAEPGDLPATEAVAVALPAKGWEEVALAMADRCGAVVVGPGLGRDASTGESVRALVAASPVPVVVDADGLAAFGSPADLRKVVGSIARAVIVTPHDGEYSRLTGTPPGPDRLGSARLLARDTGAVVLLKGPTTVVAEPSGRALLACSGGPELATAGSGDVLSGIIGAFVARGLTAPEAAAFAAHAHGSAGRWGRSRGLVAGDLADLVALWLGASGRRSRRSRRSVSGGGPGISPSPSAFSSLYDPPFSSLYGPPFSSLYDPRFSSLCGPPFSAGKGAGRGMGPRDATTSMSERCP